METFEYKNNQDEEYLKYNTYYRQNNSMKTEVKTTNFFEKFFCFLK